MEYYNISKNKFDLSELVNKTNSKSNILFIVYKIDSREFVMKMHSITDSLEKLKFNVDNIILIQNEFYIEDINNTKYIYKNENELWKSISHSFGNIRLEKDYDIIISYSNIIATEFMLSIKGNSYKVILIDREHKLDIEGYKSEYIFNLFSRLDQVIYEK